MKIIQDKEKRMLIDLVKKETGAVGVCILVADSFLPCPDALSGDKCTHPHQCHVAVEGISPWAAFQIIGDSTNMSLKDVAQEIIDNYDDENTD